MTSLLSHFKDRRFLWRHVKLALCIVVVTFIGIFVKENGDQFKVLLNLSPENLVIIICLSLIPPFVNSFRFREIVIFFGGNLCLKEWVGLTFCNTFYNYIFPGQAGLMLRALYLKRVHQFGYGNYLFLLGVNWVVNFFVADVMAFLLTGSLYFFGNQSQQYIFRIYIISGSFLVATSLIGLVARRKINFDKLNGGGRLMEYLSEMTKRLRNSPIRLANVALFQVLFLVAASIRIHYMLTIFDLDVIFYQVFMIQILINLSLIISVTPGNIGVSEGIMAYCLSQLGLDMETVFAAMVVDRSAVMLIFFILGSFFSQRLLSEGKLSNGETT